MTEKFTKFGFVILTSILLIACSPQENEKSSTVVEKASPAQCIAQQSQCQFDLLGGTVQVLFDVDKIVAEHAFNMTLHYQGTETITSMSGYLEGVDMYMGKIPLFIDSQATDKLYHEVSLPILTPSTSVLVQPPANVKNNLAQLFQAEVLVGSCSAQLMTWRIWLTFNTISNKTITKMLTVVSHRS